jgi:hypothetical protein
MTHPPHTAAQAVAWCERQVAAGTDWAGRCEQAVRVAYGMPAVYPDAAARFHDTPTIHRHGHTTPPPAGAVAVFRNNSHGHSVICSGRGWGAYSDGGPGWHGPMRHIADLRQLAPWCHASDWYLSDPWFKGTVWTLDWGAAPGSCPGTITPGARGSVVRAWQDAMIRGRWMSDTSANRDGWYGPGMERAARTMQRQLHVPVDAILGTITWGALT